MVSYLIAALILGIPMLYLAHRLLLRLEKKGYIYYSKSGGAVDRAGMAMLEVQSMMEPGKKYILEAKREQGHQSSLPGGPPDPPSGQRG